MKKNTVIYIVAGVLLAISLCLLGFGALAIYGSTSAPEPDSMMTPGILLSCIGLLTGAGGVGVILYVIKSRKDEVLPEQKVTLSIDLPGDVKVDQMTCKSCGGALSSTNVKMLAGAPTVECPYCGAVYQLTEEPKW
ncbi:MAG: hypothetical protein JXA19_04385 [Anaerolineales bacterium]|nr:hypothetical protein [Anaerolineales bacterium]